MGEYDRPDYIEVVWFGTEVFAEYGHDDGVDRRSGKCRSRDQMFRRGLTLAWHFSIFSAPPTRLAKFISSAKLAPFRAMVLFVMA